MGGAPQITLVLWRTRASTAPGGANAPVVGPP